MDWLPVSAALLLTGALALGAGGFLLPSSDDGDASDTLRIVQDQSGQWLAAAAIHELSDGTSVFTDGEGGAPPRGRPV